MSTDGGPVPPWESAISRAIFDKAFAESHPERRTALIDAICDGIWFASDKSVCVSRTWVAEALESSRFSRHWVIVDRSQVQP